MAATTNSEAMKNRTKHFALLVIRLCRAIPRSQESGIITRQLLRSATSVAANYRAVCRARSTPDFISKLGVATISIYYKTVLTELGWTVEGDIGLLTCTKANTSFTLIIAADPDSGATRISIAQQER